MIILLVILLVILYHFHFQVLIMIIMFVLPTILSLLLNSMDWFSMEKLFRKEP